MPESEPALRDDQLFPSGIFATHAGWKVTPANGRQPSCFEAGNAVRRAHLFAGRADAGFVADVHEHHIGKWLTPVKS